MIELAKEHMPQREIMALNEEKAKSAANAEVVNYLDLLNVSYFYRPDERAALGMENPYVVNGFQFGVNLNLGSFLQKPFQAKQAKADYKIAQLERLAYESELENEVKRRYYVYVQAFNELRIRSQALQDNKALSDDLQFRFEKGEATLNEYAEAKSAVSEASSAKLEVEVNYLVAKDALEQLIGVKVEDVK
ncbi:TolC family protein [Parapedobacter tibetensis]|uniref:TolC family protein n=1 Tax=Parapedobacter tibetensis TaxID=2972951 RepID=UPI00214D9B4D|nr:TolC family protein [Parapedobacter tibetensis]